MCGFCFFTFALEILVCFFPVIPGQPKFITGYVFSKHGLFPDVTELAEQIYFLIVFRAAEISWYHCGTDLLRIQIFVKTNLINCHSFFSAVFLVITC